MRRQTVMAQTPSCAPSSTKSRRSFSTLSCRCLFLVSFRDPRGQLRDVCSHFTDGPQKPSVKRNKHVTGNFGVNDGYSRKFKDLLDVCGLEWWNVSGAVN